MENMTFIAIGLSLLLAWLLWRFGFPCKARKKEYFIIPTAPAKQEPDDNFMCFMLTDGSTIATNNEVTVRATKLNSKADY